MDGKLFWDKVHGDSRLEWLGVKDEKVHIAGPGAPEGCFTLTAEGILSEKWIDILAVLIGKRPVEALIWMQRIVGYYSNMKGWNRSKIAEALDRKKGQAYIFQDGTVELRDDLPEEAVSHTV